MVHVKNAAVFTDKKTQKKNYVWLGSPKSIGSVFFSDDCSFPLSMFGFFFSLQKNAFSRFWVGFQGNFVGGTMIFEMCLISIFRAHIFPTSMPVVGVEELHAEASLRQRVWRGKNVRLFFWGTRWLFNGFSSRKCHPNAIMKTFEGRKCGSKNAISEEGR